MNYLDKIVFLDRDGVINVDVHYLNKVEELELINGSREAIKTLKDNGYKVIVITNQSGVSRGYLSQQGLFEIHQVLNKMLDGSIDDFFVCPHLPTDYCTCRKPQVGLFVEVERYYNIDYENSYMIGDKETDILAGYNANLKTIAVKTGYGETPKIATYVAENLLEAVRDIICKQQ
jgi:D-glycero-D-manno-heptose 1,7-bisphosphate phosphatase